ncbi:MAG: cobalt-precorrin-5B (C(1))-methyltransferase [Candidatus Methanoperedens sp.]|nr:cobalt-precorrin-5B (C(1))-methyltransferase [Candidatus Methanoperedens sp.]
MIDPVNKFKIPDEWIKKANMPLEILKSRINSGRYVLLSDGSLLRRGFTTGTTAAAAAKASVISLRKKNISEVYVPTPSGIRVLLQVKANSGKASAIKDPGDHASDATGGMEIVAEARECDRIIIKAGRGIGSKKGLPAINSSPMRQIEDAVKEAIGETGLKGACVEISVPKGVEIAKKTLNAQVGISGGISILGTTGFVEPWNEHLGEMKEELIRQADRIVLTTGRLGVRFSHMLFPGYNIILIGSDISRGLSAAKEKADVIISGLPGLILKWSYPDILKDSGYLTVQEMIDESPDNTLIDRGLEKAVKLSGKRVVLFNRNGTILRDSASGGKKRGDFL